MKFYSEIIKLNSNYSPCYNIIDDKAEQWRSFIPTEQFYNVLDTVIDSLMNNNLSYWMQGTYGTGKSHATGFIKNLLFKPQLEIDDIINSIGRTQLKHKLKSFREKNTVFPVIMYGANRITNQIDMSLQIELAVRRALKIAKIDPLIKTDFETYIQVIESDRSNYWDTLIDDNIELHEYVTDKKTLVNKLKSNNIDLFLTLREVLNKLNRPISVKNILPWLQEVSLFLKENNISNHIIIYWDEFTSILEKRDSEINSLLQMLAEKAEDTGVRFFLVSHRTVEQVLSVKAERDKLMGRFEDMSYVMSDITTYLIMANAIQKKDSQLWEDYRETHTNKLQYVISALSEEINQDSINNLINLFPIHPFSAYLTSYIAKVFGSAERTIFNFLNDKTKGFSYFINSYPSTTDEYLLTADYAFDFFLEGFELIEEPFYKNILQKFKNSEEKLNQEDRCYVQLFKILLLLNISHYKKNYNNINDKLVLPNRDNLILSVIDTHLQSHVEGFLSFIEKNKIIVKDHDNKYIIESYSYDRSKTLSKITEIQSKYNSVDKIFKNKHLNDLIIPFKGNQRSKDFMVIRLFDSKISKNDLLRKFNDKNLFKNDHNINIALILSLNLDERDAFRLTLEELLKENDIPICVCVLDKVFREDDLHKFLQYTAQAEISNNENDNQAEKVAVENINGLLKNWTEDARVNHNITWHIKDKNGCVNNGTVPFTDISRTIDEKISQIIFYKSLDILYPRLKTSTLWASRHAKSIAINMLSVGSFNEVDKKFHELFHDKSSNIIVKSDLRLESAYVEHPLVIIRKKLKQRIISGAKLNLVDVLNFLFIKPFGFCKNEIFYATLAFLLREYKNKWYNDTTGETISDVALIEMLVDVFRYYCDNSYNSRKNCDFRLGSESESKLIEILEEIFLISKCDSFIECRNKLADKLLINLKYPVWLLRFENEIRNDLDFQISLTSLNDMLLASTTSQAFNTSYFTQNYELLLENKEKLEKLFHNYENIDILSCFMNFIESELSHTRNNYNLNNIEGTISFLKIRLQGDPLYWDINNVKQQLNAMHIEKLNAYIDLPEKKTKNINDFQYIDMNPVSDEDIENTDKLIESYPGDFKQLLLQGIKEYESLKGIILRLIKDNPC